MCRPGRIRSCRVQTYREGTPNNRIRAAGLRDRNKLLTTGGNNRAEFASLIALSLIFGHPQG